jgi:hypothetical protein
MLQVGESTDLVPVGIRVQNVVGGTLFVVTALG